MSAATSRRSLLTTAGALGLSTLLAATTRATRSDAELIAIARELEAGERQVVAYNRDDTDMTEEAFSALLIRTGQLGTQLMGMRPVTLEGFRAKAAAIRWAMLNRIVTETGETVDSMGSFQECLAWSLVNDLETLPGAAA